ncbi:MAG: hypothetical protein H6766_04810 [Candidatus Peribacteria bacterium]|nr:MAG: hypothetical protein H6766_04810 [Candidatus Peribacteria bacterium]
MQYFINISNNNTLHPYYQDAYHDLHKKYGIKTILFYDKNKEKDITNGFHADDTIETYPYTSHDDLIQQILSIPYKDIYYINTFDEKLILITNHIKQLC